MSFVMKSPPKKILTTMDAGGSEPDLSKISDLSMDTQPNVTQRNKRKRANDCQCTKELSEMRSEMTRISSLLEKYVNLSEQTNKNLQDSISGIKTQLSDLKTTTEQSLNAVQNKVDGAISQINEIKLSTITLLSDQEKIKCHLTELDESIVIGQNKIKSLEAEFTQFKQSAEASSHSQDKLTLCEQIIKEVQNRNNRDKNIILVGLPEPNCSQPEERKSKDETDVLNVISLLGVDIPKPASIFRVGKLNPKRSRKVKVCFETLGPAKTLLRNKEKLPRDIKMYSDQTPAQQNFLQTVKNNLKLRQEKGETGLTIRYINGTPTIVKVSPKN
ncbi:unnamed protein product [Euphydryas editha]|uniref:Uncharacterized protein n=1 Tax=Euphydryas editha TaxID=104508 RepID=A0AAU9TKK8_EUPED|nr:unnamed protein product [Euphydryas editha]